MVVSMGYPQIIHLNGGFPYKPSTWSFVALHLRRFLVATPPGDRMPQLDELPGERKRTGMMVRGSVPVYPGEDSLFQVSEILQSTPAIVLLL